MIATGGEIPLIEIQDTFALLENTRKNNVNELQNTFQEFILNDGDEHIATILCSLHQTTTEAYNSDENDLVKCGIYEGGSALWECSIDLFKYLKNHKTELLEQTINVLELGCGHGLPGIFWLLLTEQRNCNDVNRGFIVFQDLNKSVLLQTTIPNIYYTLRQYYGYDHVLNILKTRCKFFYGSWEDFLLQTIPNNFSTTSLVLNQEPNKLKSDQSHTLVFDLILASECIYRRENFQILVKILERYLKKSQQSLGLFAAKRYYFGIGGGSLLFLQSLSLNGITLSSERQTKPPSDTSPSVVELQLFGDTSTQFKSINEDIGIQSLEEKQNHDDINPLFEGQIIESQKDGKSNIRDIIKIHWLL